MDFLAPPPIRSALLDGPDVSSDGSGMKIQTDASGSASLGNLQRQWVLWLTGIITQLNAIIALANTPAISAYSYYDLIPSGSSVTIDFTNGFTFRLTLGATTFTILAPVFTNGDIVAGMQFSLYIDQDATGGRVNPVFTTGANGFAIDVAGMSIDPTLSTETSCQFTFDGNIWKLDYTPRTGGAIT